MHEGGYMHLPGKSSGSLGAMRAHVAVYSA